ncbi:methyltransferase [Patescibacteria group bacterium]|nr:methyltransferase [Patescibacteria group bacterium]MCL5409901.1 methyltransferase [Patescibacteria group bacterium]
MDKSQALRNFDVSSVSIADYVILSCAHQMGLLTLLSTNKVTADRLNKTMPRFRRILPAVLNALVTYRYVQFKNQYYSLNPKYKNLLTDSNTMVLNNYDWYFLIAQAPDLIRGHKKASIMDKTYNSFIDISEKLSEDALAVFENRFPEVLSGQKTILDLGAGKLGLERELLKHNPRLMVTAVEQNKYPLSFLKTVLKKEKLSSRVKVIKGEAVTKSAELTGRYDFIFLSHLLHWLTEKQTKQLLRSCKKLLAENGHCVIYEDYVSETNHSPKSSVRKNLSLSILGYQVFNVKEVRLLLRSCGFKKVAKQVIKGRRVLFFAQ